VGVNDSLNSRLIRIVHHCEPDVIAQTMNNYIVRQCPIPTIIAHSYSPEARQSNQQLIV